jgi:hypothetical protein
MVNLSLHREHEYARVARVRKPREKFGPCSGRDKFYPHGAASPKSMRGNATSSQHCTIGGDWGGKFIDKIGRGILLPRPKSFSLFWASF